VSRRWRSAPASNSDWTASELLYVKWSFAIFVHGVYVHPQLQQRPYRFRTPTVRGEVRRPRSTSKLSLHECAGLH
jgi:hypothetical protein